MKRHRWSSVIRYGWQIGKSGFTPINKHPQHAINIGEVELGIDRLIEKGKTKQSDGMIELNLREMGYTKLLGNGTVTHPFKIHVDSCSEKAQAKIGQAGGQVILPESSQPVKEG